MSTKAAFVGVFICVSLSVLLFAKATAGPTIPKSRLTILEAVRKGEEAGRASGETNCFVLAAEWARTAGFKPHTGDGGQYFVMPSTNEWMWFVYIYRPGALGRRPWINEINIFQIDEDGHASMLRKSKLYVAQAI